MGQHQETIWANSGDCSAKERALGVTGQFGPCVGFAICWAGDLVLQFTSLENESPALCFLNLQGPFKTKIPYKCEGL